MFAQAVSTTTVLLVVSLLSKLLYEPSHEGASVSHELLRQAVHLRDVALQDADGTLKLQHAAAAAATLQAARTLARDADLERASGLDVSRLARSLDGHVADARRALLPSKRQTS
jgi:hypothetical protein